MCPTEMVVPQAEVKLTLQPIVFFGKAQGLARETPVLVAHCAILPLYERRIEMPVDG